MPYWTPHADDPDVVFARSDEAETEVRVSRLDGQFQVQSRRLHVGPWADHGSTSTIDDARVTINEILEAPPSPEAVDLIPRLDAAGAVLTEHGHIAEAATVNATVLVLRRLALPATHDLAL